MAALLSSAFLLVGNLPEQSLTETMYDYIMRVSLLPFMWFMTAMVLGVIRARQLHERKDMLERLSKSEQASASIVGNYKAVKKSKEQLEVRLAEERCSVQAIYEIAQMLETLDPAEAKKGVEKLVSTALNPRKFSLFVAGGNVLKLEFSHGWKKSDTYSKRFGLKTPFIAHAGKTGQPLSIVKHSEEQLLDGEGMMAGLLTDEKTGKILGMLKIEEIGFTDLNGRAHETFQIICAWIARVYMNINKHKAATTKRSKITLGKRKSVRRTEPGIPAAPTDGYAEEIQDNAA
jgi:hypothetical protein